MSSCDVSGLLAEGRQGPRNRRPSERLSWLRVAVAITAMAGGCAAPEAGDSEAERDAGAEEELALGEIENALSDGCPVGETIVCTVDPTSPAHTKICECTPVKLHCPTGKVQVDNACVPCGQSGQIRCATGCGVGLAIGQGTTCSPCGNVGQQTCDGNVCNQGLEPVSVPNNTAYGRSNICYLCGDVGQPTCATRSHCNPGLEEWHGACRTLVSRVPEEEEGCGGLGESCCTDPI